MALLSTAAQLATDPDFMERATLAAAQQGITYPEAWIAEHKYMLASNTEVAAAYEASLINLPYHSRRGYDPVIITDDMIRGAIAELQTKPDMAQA